MATVGFVASKTLVKPQKQNLSISKLPIYKSHSLNQKAPNLQKLLFPTAPADAKISVGILTQVQVSDNFPHSHNNTMILKKKILSNYELSVSSINPKESYPKKSFKKYTYQALEKNETLNKIEDNVLQDTTSLESIAKKYQEEINEVDSNDNSEIISEIDNEDSITKNLMRYQTKNIDHHHFFENNNYMYKSLLMKFYHKDNEHIDDKLEIFEKEMKEIASTIEMIEKSKKVYSKLLNQIRNLDQDSFLSSLDEDNKLLKYLFAIKPTYENRFKWYKEIVSKIKNTIVNYLIAKSSFEN